MIMPLNRYGLSRSSVIAAPFAANFAAWLLTGGCCRMPQGTERAKA